MTFACWFFLGLFVVDAIMWAVLSHQLAKSRDRAIIGMATAVERYHSLLAAIAKHKESEGEWTRDSDLYEAAGLLEEESEEQL